MLCRDAASTLREHAQIAQRLRIRHHVATAAQTDARRRAIGHVVLLVFMGLALGMASYAMHVDRLQQQQWERLK